MDRMGLAGVFVGLIAVAGFGGCSNRPANVGYVKGKVTLDGQPVPNALVSFTPTKTGAGTVSNARTDANGDYILSYTKDIQGADVGEHTVRVTTFQPANPDEEPPTALVPEKIPAKYNTKSELKKEVKEGNNEINIELKTDGPVVQPVQGPD